MLVRNGGKGLRRASEGKVRLEAGLGTWAEFRTESTSCWKEDTEDWKEANRGYNPTMAQGQCRDLAWTGERQLG